MPRSTKPAVVEILLISIAPKKCHVLSHEKLELKFVV
jgi:hypothetical protein